MSDHIPASVSEILFNAVIIYTSSVVFTYLALLAIGGN